MWANYMLQVAPGYGTNPFPAPPTNMVSGTPAATPKTPAAPTTQATVPAPQPSAPAAPGNGDKKG